MSYLKKLEAFQRECLEEIRKFLQNSSEGIFEFDEVEYTFNGECFELSVPISFIGDYENETGWVASVELLSNNTLEFCVEREEESDKFNEEEVLAWNPSLLAAMLDEISIQ